LKKAKVSLLRKKKIMKKGDEEEKPFADFSIPKNLI